MDLVLKWTDSLGRHNDPSANIFEQKALKYTREHPDPAVQLFYRRYQGLIFLVGQQNDSARLWFRKALGYVKANMPEQAIFTLYEDIAKSFRFESQYDSASVYFKKVESLIMGTADSTELDWVYFQFGSGRR